MDKLVELVMIFLSMVLVNNFVFTKFLGTCPYIGVSNRVEMAFGMGAAVTFVTTLSGIMSWLVNVKILNPIGMPYLKYIVFILVIAAMVQLVEMYLRKFFRSLYDAFGIFLPLITTNCVVLGICLFLDLWGYGFLESLVASFGVGLGFTVAICIMAGIRENLKWADMPECLKGAPITLITAGILTLAFMGFSGMIK
jgi:Na+-translocating ferredoxin:NAD+ oxidoreductase subunit A